MFILFKRVVNFFHGSGLGRLPGIKLIYNFLFSSLRPQGTQIINTDVGKLMVDTSDTGEVPYLLMRGSYDKFESETIRKFLLSGMTAIDIGAHIGYFTILMAKIVGNTGKVYAFDPEPKNFKLLSENLNLNRVTNVKLVNAALSDKEGRTDLFLDDKNLGNPSFAKENIPSGSLSAGIGVHTLTLDSYMDGRKADFIKIDVQGAEGLIFSGAKKLLSGNLRILMEFWPYGLRNVGTDPLIMLEKLRSSGYNFYIIDSNAKILKPKTPNLLMNVAGNRPEGRGWANVLCLKTNNAAGEF